MYADVVPSHAINHVGTDNLPSESVDSCVFINEKLRFEDS